MDDHAGAEIHTAAWGGPHAAIGRCSLWRTHAGVTPLAGTLGGPMLEQSIPEGL